MRTQVLIVILFAAVFADRQACAQGAMQAGSAEAYSALANQPGPAWKPPKNWLNCDSLSLASSGYFNSTACVEQIVDEKTALVWYQGKPISRTANQIVHVVLCGYPTQGLVDRSAIDAKLYVRVSGTRKLADGGTVFELTVITAPETIAREEDERVKAVKEADEARDPKVRAKRREEAEAKKKADAIAAVRAKASAREADKEGTAAAKLKLARSLLDSNPDRAKERLGEIVDKFPGTAAARDAAKLLKDAQ